MNNKDSFASSFGVLLALAGSAVGLGNLWRFPYLVGTNGGAAFIIIYLAIVLILALPIMYAEFILGRKAQCDIVGGFKVLAPKSPWIGVGFIRLLCTTMIISFYSVVGGWIINYIVKAASAAFTAENADFSQMFNATITSNWEPLAYMAVFVGLSAVILLAGVKDGIEKYSKILMPLLFVMVIIVAVRSVTLPGAQKGIEFLFKPDFSKVTADTFLNALGQAFFSLSIGAGMVFTYGSYVRKSENVVSISAKTALMDTMFAIIAGVAIMPAVFSFGISPSEGPGLVFVTLPYIFAHIPLGYLLSILFFFVLFIAAITSSISLLEVMVAYLMGEFRLSRKLSVCIAAGTVLILGTLCSLSQGVLDDVKVLGNSIFDFFDKTSANILMPIAAFLFVIFAAWKLRKEDFMDELTSGGLHKFNRPFRLFIYYSVKFLAPAAIALIMIQGLM